MLENIIFSIAFILISGPFSLFIGKRILKIDQLRLWHIWLAVSASILISYIGYILFLGILLYVFSNYWLCILFIGALVFTTYHSILKKFNPDIKLNQSFTLIFTLLLLIFIIILLSIPFYNSYFF
jgi:hypothetical protein